MGKLKAISFAITCCTELNELKSLIPHLLKYKREEDEIVILYDCINGSEEVEEYLRSIEPGLTYNPIDKFNFRWYSYDFDGDFSKMKNFLIEMCKGGFIMQLDSDELPNEHLLENLPQIINFNPDVEAYNIARINIVDNIGLSYIQSWGWRVTVLSGFVNEKEFDLDNPQDKDEYDLLVKYNLIIDEENMSYK